MVKNISIDSNSGQADSNNTDKKCLRGASCGMENYEYSDRMLEAMQTSVVFFDPEGIVYRVNSLACRDLKIEKNPENCKVNRMLSIIHNNTDIFPGLMTQLYNSDTGQVWFPSEAFIRCHIGQVQFFVNGCIMRMQDGNYLLTFRNITDEVTHEHILSMILARTKIFPWFYDMDRNKMLIDEHWFSYLGIPKGDCTISSEDFFALVHPDEREMLSEALRRQLVDHEIQDSFSYRLRRGDGTWEWFSEQSMYMGKTDDGLPYRIVGVCQSIQDHKIIEENLRAARNKAQESDKLKSAFLANMSHEIRTPLNAIVGFSDLLATGYTEIKSEEAKEFAGLINKNCNILLTLVSDVLDMSRIESDSMNFSFSEHSLVKFLSDIHEKYKDKIPGQIKFNLLLPSGDVKIKTDSLRLKQALFHLLDNAVKFTKNGHIDMGCTCSSDGKNVCLFISDTGIGIPYGQTERIFERFYKVDSFMQGAGLGLSICKTISEGLGGEISVSSHPGKGAKFSLLLPLGAQKNAS